MMKMERHRIDISAAEVNEMVAVIRLRTTRTAEPGLELACGIFEIGYDGGLPETALAVGSVRPKPQELGDGSRVELELRIGTPMCWSTQTPCRYAALVAIESGGVNREWAEIRFGILKHGGLTAIEHSPSPRRLARTHDPLLPSLFVIGDSTAASNWVNQLGWGTPLKEFFDPHRINILNRARAGRSTRSFIREGLWAAALAEMKKDDVVLIQFGHNDADTIDRGRCRGVLPGIGEETQRVTVADGEEETVHSFGWYLRQMIADVRARGGKPVVLSPTAKNIWKDDVLDGNQGGHGVWAAGVAAMEAAPFIDLTAMIAQHYDGLGRDRVAELFCSSADTVHTSPEGARLNARLVVSALKSIPGTIPDGC